MSNEKMTSLSCTSLNIACVRVTNKNKSDSFQKNVEALIAETYFGHSFYIPD